MAQIGRIPNTKVQPQQTKVQLDFLGAPIGAEETPAQRFERTGVPQEDPANVDPMADFLGPAQQPEIAPYDWTAAGMPLPKAFQPVGDVVAGFNQGLANTLGIPLDAVDYMMRTIGMEGTLDKPGTGRDAVIRAMESMGIGADKKKAASKLLADMGEASGENLVMLSAMLAAAPTMMSAQGSGMVNTFVRDLGTALIQHPWIAGISEVTSGVGGEAGAQLGSNFGPTGEALGGMAGALMGGVSPGLAAEGIGSAMGLPGLATTVRMAAKGLGEGMGDISAQARAGRSAIGSGVEPLLRDAAPDTGIIAQAIKGDQMRVEGIIEKLSRKMTQSADPIESAEQLREVQRKAYPVARKMERGYWEKVDQKRPVVTDELKAWRQSLIDNTVAEGRDEWLPNDLLNDIANMSGLAKIENLRAVRTKAFSRLQTGTVPSQQGVLPLNDQMRRNLSSVIDEIDKAITKAYPNDLEMQKATGFSRWLHNRFTRGPVAQFAQPRATDDMLPDIEPASRRAFRNKKFGEQTADVAEQLNMPAMVTGAEQFVRGQLAAEINRIGPQNAEKFLKMPSTKSFLRAYPRVAAEWQSTGQRLQDMLAYRKEVMNSGFIKLAGEAPDTAIARVITSRTRVQDAKQLMRRIGKNPDALEAAKHGLIQEVERMAGGNPDKILQIINGTDVRSAMTQILGSTDMARMERIAREASAYMGAKKDGIPQFVLRRGGRVIGSYLGRKLNTGTLQAPEFGGRLVQKMVNDWLGTAEDDIFSRAIRYPAWEAVLKAKAPESLSDVGRLQALIRRAIRVEEATERSLVPVRDLIEDEDE